jgi:hypothetical protein
VLEEGHGWLRELALGELRDPVRFWAKLDGLPAAAPTAEARALLVGALPAGASSSCKITHRVAGLGSLGRPRYVAVATVHGGLVAREVKALYPSAWSWVNGDAEAPIRCGELAAAAIRCPDPFLSFALSDDRRHGWVTRRLAPHCCRVELGTLSHRREDKRLLRAMGQEAANVHLANVHLGSVGALGAVLADLDHRPAGWLSRAAQAMAKATQDDWKAWRK